MKIAFFSSKDYDEVSFQKANADFQYSLTFFTTHLNVDTAKMASGFEAVCCFVNDDLSEPVLKQLHEQGVKLIALRSAGFNHVDLDAAKQYGLTVVRVPTYSPYAVAEHALCLILALNRHINRAYNRVREGDFSLRGLIGFDLHGTTVGVIGTGQIGEAFIRCISGFGCRIIAADVIENEVCKKLGVKYVPIDELFRQSKIISLHCPLTPETHHLIDHQAVDKMQQGVMLINTSRGAVVDTKAVIAGLKSLKIGYLGLDVYEEEADLFFKDLSDQIIQDDVFARLLSFPNVIITSHQGFFTQQAIHNIAKTTLENIKAFEEGAELKNQV